MMKTKLTAWVVTLASLGSLTVAPAFATHQNNYNPYTRQSEVRSLVKPALIGAGLGAVAGGVLSRNDRSRGAIKGAVVGAIAGGGYGFLRNRGYLNGIGSLNPFSRNQYNAYNPGYGY